jgi:hypothetical protein
MFVAFLYGAATRLLFTIVMTSIDLWCKVFSIVSLAGFYSCRVMWFSSRCEIIPTQTVVMVLAHLP